MGERLSGRPGWLSEIEYDQRSYRHPHPVDWATGAALMISSEVDHQVGEWDERYFLYSEETDYLRRVRMAGWEVWFEPQASVQHRRGGSGSSAELNALMAVNRVRYAEVYHHRPLAVLFRGTVIFASALRIRSQHHQVALRYLLRRRAWTALPQANDRRDVSPG